MVGMGRIAASMIDLLSAPRIGRDETRAFQDGRLRTLVEHAYRRVPYYKRLLDKSGVSPADIRGVRDISLIPISGKADIQSLARGEIVSGEIDSERLIQHTTSGSTGVPLTIRRTRFEEYYLMALRHRAVAALGLRTTDRAVRLGLLPSSRRRLNDSLPSRVARMLGIFRREDLDCLAPVTETLSSLQHARPDVLTSYPGVFMELIREAPKEELRAIHPRFMTSGGEVLTPFMRRTIENAFHAPLYQIYGSYEFNLIAIECVRTGNFHISDQGVIVEILDGERPVGPGERGEVVITGLHSFAMPFIRFRLGDLAIRGEEICECGELCSTLRSIEGRKIEAFRLPGGRMVNPYKFILSARLRDNWVGQYQVTQEEFSRVVVRIVPASAPSPEQLDRVNQGGKEILGEGVELRVELLSHLKTGPNGKPGLTRSLVQSVYDMED